MTKDEALKLALEAMLNFSDDISDEMFEAITAIKEALAQPEQTNIERHEANVQKFLGAPQLEQEPVAWWNQKKDSVSTDLVHRHNPDCQPLYTAPPQLEPLIDEQVDDEFKLYASLFDTSGDKWLDMDAYDYFKAGFKAAHGIKE